jgi:outer membrane protein TolC
VLLRRFLSLAILLAGAQALPAQSADAPAKHDDPELDPPRIRFVGEPIPLSLREVISLAIEQNLDIEIRDADTVIADARVLAEQGIYDPTLIGSAGTTYTDTQTAQLNGGELGEVRQRSLDAAGAVSQLLPSGATAQVGYTSSRTDVSDSRRFSLLDPANTQRGYVSIRQPLLKNFGPMVTNQGVRVARKRQEIADLLYQQEVLDQLSNVMNAYWELVFSRRNLEVQRVSLESALELERVNEARVKAGSSPRADLLQAKAQSAQRRNSVIEAKSAILAAQDRLLQLLNWSGKTERQWERPVEPTDRPTSFSLTLEYDDTSLIGEAIETRPDFKASQLSVEIAEINRRVANWQRLPQLDLLGEYGLNGVDDSANGAFSEVRQNDYEDSFLGAEFRYPLFNRRARGESLATKGELQRSEILRDQTELLLVTDVRAASRAIRTAQESIEASDAQVKAAAETLDVERRRLDVGGSTTFNVLQFQEDLAEAEVAQVRAYVDYQLGLIELERSRGKLVDVLGRDLGIQFRFVAPEPSR